MKKPTRSIIMNTTKVLSGTKIQGQIRDALASSFKETRPTLSIVLVGEDPRSLQYVRMKQRFGEDLGVAVWVNKIPDTTSKEELIKIITDLHDGSTGIMIQLPLPKNLSGDTEEILRSIRTSHDVDLLNPESISEYRKGNSNLEPPVAGGVKHLLKEAGIVLGDGNSQKIVIVGNGRTVGTPVADLLRLHKQKFSVVTKEMEKDEIDKMLISADIIISGAGDPHFIKPSMVKKGVVLIDAGVSFVLGELRGDVDPACYEKASAHSPVPGGVGPAGIAVLFENLFRLSSVYASS
jgi:methylenetetrahydrofolate dehydrogenase (NADP+)/methenyltetrahydrofolate cyclohydrolase